MEKLFVFGDFDWLHEPELIGELCYEKLRGSDSYAFRFDNDWLKLHAGIKALAKQMQIPQREQAMFKDRFKLNLNYN